ncbi:MAG: hypothetical protein DWQ19_11675 [Crenarchaeota archaeon]|nr:MAG: hypothetical protein DWQ19_11675 [Thermoproteota archaeon]
MKKFNEWQAEVNEHLDPDVLREKVNDLAHQLHLELQSFQGDRFEGFLELTGAVHNLRRVLAGLETDTLDDMPQYITSEDCGEPHKPRKMKKINHKEVTSKGVRKGEKDLSKDYKGHLASNGDEEPFKVLKK